MGEPFNLLFVCTGNICRSPMAEGLAREAVRRGYPARAAEVSVGSAGVAGLDGEPATAEAVAAMGARGIDISAHRARSTSRDILGRADLVLAMEESHRRYLEPFAGRTPVYLLLRFAEACLEEARSRTRHERLGADGGGGTGSPPPGPRSALPGIVEIAGRIERGDLWENPAFAYDVADPIGMRLGDYQCLAAEMAGPVELVIAALLEGGEPGPGPASRREKP